MLKKKTEAVAGNRTQAVWFNIATSAPPLSYDHPADSNTKTIMYSFLGQFFAETCLCAHALCMHFRLPRNNECMINFKKATMGILGKIRKRLLSKRSDEDTPQYECTECTECSALKLQINGMSP